MTADQIRQAEALRASGEPVPVIAETLGVSRATLYRTLAEQAPPGSAKYKLLIRLPAPVGWWPGYTDSIGIASVTQSCSPPR